MHLHLDCQFGIAGDMLLASLIDAGADQGVIVDTLRNIPLDGFNLAVSRTERGGVSANLVDVIDFTRTGHHGGLHHHDAPQRSNDPHDHSHDHEHGHPDDHEHHHSDPHHHGHHHHHDEDSGPHRHLADLLALLDGPGLSNRVKERAARIFRIVAEAEATVHGQPVDKVHFHEISGIDTAVDVIGSCIALDLLDVDSISAAPPAAGSGMLMCEHGIFPVPAPATLEIFKSHNIPWHAGGEGERTTPTGAALLAGLVDAFGDSPEITVTRIGYGAGHREYAEAPNLLRAIIGKPGTARKVDAPRRESSKTIIAAGIPEPSADLVRVPPEDPRLPATVAAMLPGDVLDGGERVVEFRFAVDDMTPEAIGYLIERALATGALDAYAIPATMKKNRPGHEITILTMPELAPVVADLIWHESTTFGVRVGERSRILLQREFRTVHILGHDIRVKLGWHDGVVIRRQPEYEDCRLAAISTGLPLEDVFRLARDAARAEQH